MVLLCTFGTTKSHDLNTEHSTAGLRVWHLKNGKHLHAYFLLSRDEQVVLEQKNRETLTVSLGELSRADQSFVQEKKTAILRLNQTAAAPAKPKVDDGLATADDHTLLPRFWMFSLLLPLLLGLLLWIRRYSRHHTQAGFLANKQAAASLHKASAVFILLLFVGGGFLLFTSAGKATKAAAAATNPAFLDSAFTPFKPSVHTRWDNNYFYVESNGIPDHNMMVGITSWQQQVPLPQCYIGTNAWSIPLNPAMAVTPVPVNNKHFLRGAIALAANGVPIFNPYTNTGVDAFLDGQLDQWGGHSGRADDYHYHNAPLFLEKQSGPTLPIAFALDGHAVYGSKEPDGSAMKTLDANHGHWGADGRYHYHGSTAAPYMIGQMAGVVTEDSTLQIVPQPAAKGVRPALTPLKGAVITGFHPNGTNSYTLIYTLSGKTDSVVYSWDNAGNYTYNFYSSGVKSTSNYKGSAPCKVPVGIANLELGTYFTVYPVPASDKIAIRLNGSFPAAEVSSYRLYNQQGKQVYSSSGYKPVIDVSHFAAGVYLLEIRTHLGKSTHKLIIQPGL